MSYLAALHVLLGVAILKTNFIPKVKLKLGLPTTAADAHIENMLRFHKWMDASVPDHATIFLGDSMVQSLATAAVAPRSVNYGIGSANTTTLLDAIPIYESLYRAGAIVLAIGINDFIFDQQRGLVERYGKIIDALPRKTPLIWSSVMPIANIEPKLAADIRQVNQAIEHLCAQRGNCVYVDTWTFMTGVDGRTNDTLFLDDRVHLNAAGYERWIGALKKAFTQIEV